MLVQTNEVRAFAMGAKTTLVLKPSATQMRQQNENATGIESRSGGQLWSKCCVRKAGGVMQHLKFESAKKFSSPTLE